MGRERAANVGHTPTTRSLDGFTVGVTADRRWEEQAALLERRGARVVHGASIRTVQLVADDGIREATRDLIARPPQWLVAITGIGIRGWLSAVESWGMHDEVMGALAETQVVARGPKAAGAASAAGLELAWVAPGERLSDVVAFFAERDVAGCRIAVQMHGDDDEQLTDGLRSLGADVVSVPVYRWTLPLDDGPALRLAAGVLDETIDAVTFTSAPAVRNFFLILQQHDLVGAVRSRFADGVAFVTVGPVCSEEARAWGVERPVEPGRARMGSMIRALCDSLAVRRRDLVIGGVPVVLQGTALAIDGGDLVHLTDRERALFRVMLDRSGQVVPRAILMRQVWGVGQADPHTLEVTVARLRRRLGDAGTGLKTVPRRGYLLDVSA